MIEPRELMKILCVTALAVCALACQASARVYFQSKSEMIAEADAIAVITISKVEDTSAHELQLGYAKVAEAKVEMVLKGELGKSLKIHGNETFKCGQCPLTKGRFLAFLRKADPIWVGANWHLSLRPIEKDKVMWHARDDDRFTMEACDLKTVITEIKAAIAESSKAAKQSIDDN